MTAEMQRQPITVRLESFEGPLDLLLYLIQSHELDISKISITTITDQYLAYVRLMQELNFDTASEFLVMAATLLHWKSKAILPKEQDPNALEDAQDATMSQEDLVRQLLEHQRFLAAGQDLQQLPLLGEDVFVRPNRKPPIEKIWKTMDLTDLTLSYQDMLTRQRKRTTVLRKETVSIAGKIVEFRDRIKPGQLTGLRSLLADDKSDPETVVTFLASLELSRLRKMRLHQERTYAEIYLELLESLHNFNAEEEFTSEFDKPKSPEAPLDAHGQPAIPAPNDFQFLHLPENGADATISVELLRNELAAPNAAHTT
jgi:segregation and condensation protein A